MLSIPTRITDFQDEPKKIPKDMVEVDVCKDCGFIARKEEEKAAHVHQAWFHWIVERKNLSQHRTHVQSIEPVVIKK